MSQQPSEYEFQLHDAEVRLARLKALYEQYFQGIEKLEPTVPRKEFDRLIEVLRKTQPRNTALRFRLQTLTARYSTYQTFWQRTARQIEEGTYRRDVVRVQQQRRARESPEATRAKAAEAARVAEAAKAAEAAKPVARDDADFDAILGALAPRVSSPGAQPRRPISPFATRPAAAAPASPAANATASPATAPIAAAPTATAPATTFAKPATTFAKPATTFAKPAATFAKPVATFAKPAPAPAAPATAAPAPPPAPTSVARPVPPPPPPAARPAPPPLPTAPKKF